MPRNDKMTISIIREQCNSVDERCDDYRGKLAEAALMIIEYEREHRVMRTDIQKKINNQCNRLGQVLVEMDKRNADTEVRDS